jgi:hypothetical protein
MQKIIYTSFIYTFSLLVILVNITSKIILVYIMHKTIHPDFVIYLPVEPNPPFPLSVDV